MPEPASVLQQMQRTCGNQAVLRHLAVQRDTGSGSGTPARPAPQQPPARAPVVPTEEWVIPFDRTPLSAPGEEVLFNGVFSHAVPADFQFVFTGVGGKFDSATGSATKTVAGLDSGNVPFFIDRAWNGTTQVKVNLELKRVADGSVVKTYSWTFGRKTQLPTTITQDQPETELPLGAKYDYKLGPDLLNDGKIDYGHETILESFDPPTSNLTMADMKPAWKTANPGVTTSAGLVSHFFPAGSGANGTFVVDADDKIHDQHDGMPDKSDFDSALVRMKEIHFDIVQTYTVKPGQALGKYTIRRILKPDGTKLVKKTKL